ncbi:DUF4114 domain-containing protein [Limnofasciculus baicalensis]|uniref:DUF4114 domain-containing protein n=1 Tax=Limnofasciculus baicalensis BBK-W-15 TaxID=2699891 RepID=A0AAE3GNH2_9CYAN|nr:DUF4114 domain-containing protein [Limnofasciculus baicalensis]MCP2727624.1 DUF4114 domain-containing protein [Limnofasciculus baicalensis BBK-W-15]
MENIQLVVIDGIDPLNLSGGHGLSDSDKYVLSGSLDHNSFHSLFTPKYFDMRPGDKFGFMLVPNGRVQEVQITSGFVGFLAMFITPSTFQGKCYLLMRNIEKQIAAK